MTRFSNLYCLFFFFQCSLLFHLFLSISFLVFQQFSCRMLVLYIPHWGNFTTVKIFQDKYISLSFLFYFHYFSLSFYLFFSFSLFLLSVLHHLSFLYRLHHFLFFFIFSFFSIIIFLFPFPFFFSLHWLYAFCFSL